MVAGTGHRMSLLVNFLAPADVPSELRTLLRQLALLWKFELCELLPGKTINTFDPDRPLIIDAGSDERDFQESVVQYIGASRSRCLLFSTKADFNHSELKVLSGVSAIVQYAYQFDLRVDICENDALLKGLVSPLRLLRFNECVCGEICLGDAHPLLAADNGTILMARRGDCYTVALPTWQFGIVSFPAWFKILENVLFFNDCMPHLAPGPYVAIRIDDMPVTGESYIKQGYTEFRGCAEIRAIQRASALHGVRIEYMLTEYVFKDGKCRPAQEVAPKAIGLLADLYHKGEINIGGHGYVHLDVTAYQLCGKIEAREFLAMGEGETRTALLSIKRWLSTTFRKRKFGFVAPAWGYREDITKPIARNIFCYIADSNQSLQRSDGGELFGSVKAGCVNMFETWRSGMSGIRMADRNIFSAYLDTGLPVHLMMHSALTSDPLTYGRRLIFLILAIGMVLFFNLLLGLKLDFSALAIFILGQSVFTWWLYSHRHNLGWCLRWIMSYRIGNVDRIEHLALGASRSGAQWLFVEELAEQMAAYEGLTMRIETSNSGTMCLSINCSKKFRRPVSVHFHFLVKQAVLRPSGQLEIKNNVVRIGPLDSGIYQLNVFGDNE